jgi:hypothetical protein
MALGCPIKKLCALCVLCGEKDALTFADDDINENWEIYRTRFLSGGFP